MGGRGRESCDGKILVYWRRQKWQRQRRQSLSSAAGGRGGVSHFRCNWQHFRNTIPVFVRALLPPVRSRELLFSLAPASPFPLCSLSAAPFHLRFFARHQPIVCISKEDTHAHTHTDSHKNTHTVLSGGPPPTRARLGSLETNISTALIYLLDNKHLTGRWGLEASPSESSTFICILSTDPHRGPEGVVLFLDQKSESLFWKLSAA